METTLKTFVVNNKWWIAAAAVVAVAVIVVFLIKRRGVKKEKSFDRSKYKTITPEQSEKLEELHEEVKERFYELVDEAQKLGYKAQITSSYRSFEHQLRLKKQLGSMAATPGKSPHNYGLAVDIVLWKDDKKYGNYSASKSEWEATGVPAMARKLGFTWGGDFKSHPFDPVHFDLVKNLGVTTAALFEKGKQTFGSPEKIIGNKIPLA